jgi:hypothetical protein
VNRWVVAAGGAALAGLAVLVVPALLTGSDDRGQDPSTVSPAPTLTGYTITYRVEVTIGAPERSRRVLAVRRPFDGSDRTTPDGSGRPESGLVARGGHLFRLDPDKAVDFGDQGPVVAPGDLQVAAQLPALERLGLALPQGSATVAGRACHRYRFGAPLADGFKVPTDTEYADVCLDGDGLVLAEDWYLDGRLLRHTAAESVVLGPPPDDAFDLGGRTVVATPTVTVTALPSQSIPDTGRPYWTVDRPPEGFTLLRRYRSAAVDLSSGVPLADGGMTADAYRAGADVIWVEHRAELALEPPEGAGEQVEAGTLGAGWLWLTPQGPQIRVGTGGQVVLVRGTVAPDRLVAFARSLGPRQGGR